MADELDEALDVITGLWSGEAFTYHGKCYDVEEVTFLPKPIQEPRIPIWVGGESKGALKRASRFDGWVIGGLAPSVGPGGFSLGQVSRAVKTIKHYQEADKPFDVVYGMEFQQEDQLLEETIQKAKSVGVTWMLEGIYGLRYSTDQALERVRKGPPQIKYKSTVGKDQH